MPHRNPLKGREGGKKPWQFMTRFDIADRANGEDLYLRRWRIIQTPYCALYLHHIMRPDSNPLVHDHPWTFISIILRGGYREMVADDNDPTKLRSRHIKRINFKRKDQAHYIYSMDRGSVWSLLLVGARRKTWGFRRQTATGYQWTRYDLY